ncbi:MAG: hypothetical protein ACXVCX_21465 [Ktedonobacterales bacterium]
MNPFLWTVYLVCALVEQDFKHWLCPRGCPHYPACCGKTYPSHCGSRLN